MDIDLISPDQWTEGIPHKQFEWLRTNAPVYWHTSDDPSTPDFWALTLHPDVIAVSRDVERYSSQRGGVFLNNQSDEDRELFRSIIETDRPEHTRLRRLVNRGFTPRSVAEFGTTYRVAVRNVLASALERGSFDWVTEVATALPAYAISELLGVPTEDRPKVTTWTNTISGANDPEFAQSAEAPLEAATALYTYATKLAQQRRAEPRDDIVTKLITEVDDDALGEHEFEIFVLALAVAGNETTRTAMSQGMLALLDHPDQMQRLRSNAALAGSAADEMIRWSSPIVYFRRTATCDLEIRGVTIQENDPVALYYLSANYDGNVFREPYRFDVARSPNPHVSFGGGGPHHCLGAHLARLEITMLLEELLATTGSIERTGDPQRLRSSWINGLKHLPVAVMA
ncbi:MAG TPA: cytochrome P450 [Acidimicrobiales bacterium]|nr:cytochrome P450 [Acidimicrobiales bacterium]